jgi:hypothetical protein
VRARVRRLATWAQAVSDLPSAHRKEWSGPSEIWAQRKSPPGWVALRGKWAAGLRFQPTRAHPLLIFFFLCIFLFSFLLFSNLGFKFEFIFVKFILRLNLNNPLNRI